jgi:hypothetical protein
MERAVKLYREHALWPYVQKLIGYEELIPEPDETVEETAPATSAPESEQSEPTT